MHHSGPLPITFEDPEHGFGGKNCQMGVGENLVNSYDLTNL